MAKKKVSQYLRPFKNIYILVLIGFSIWMIFFDAHSLLLHHELNQEIKELESEKEYYKNEMKKDRKAIKELSTPEGAERMARETYFMKRPNEEIYIIEYEDSIQQTKKP